MSVHLEHCGDETCGRLFEVEQFSLTFGPGHVPGQIECPHCGGRVAGDPHKVYLSRKLAPELEDWPEEGRRADVGPANGPRAATPGPTARRRVGDDSLVQAKARARQTNTG